MILLRRWYARLVVGGVLIAALVVGGTAFRVWQVARDDDREHADVILVLGAAQYNGTPSPIFQARLMHAKRLLHDGVARRIVTTGGKESGDNFTEAQAGANWLTAHGVAASKVIPVGYGRDTLSSMQWVAKSLHRRHLASAVIVSDPWHSLRARTMAGDLDIEATTSPTHSGPIVQTRRTQFFYIWRETTALLYYKLVHSRINGLSGPGMG